MRCGKRESYGVGVSWRVIFQKHGNIYIKGKATFFFSFFFLYFFLGGEEDPELVSKYFKWKKKYFRGYLSLQQFKKLRNTARYFSSL